MRLLARVCQTVRAKVRPPLSGPISGSEPYGKWTHATNYIYTSSLAEGLANSIPMSLTSYLNQSYESVKNFRTIWRRLENLMGQISKPISKVKKCNECYFIYGLDWALNSEWFGVLVLIDADFLLLVIVLKFCICSIPRHSSIIARCIREPSTITDNQTVIRSSAQATVVCTSAPRTWLHQPEWRSDDVVWKCHSNPIMTSITYVFHNAYTSAPLSGRGWKIFIKSYFQPW